MPRIRFSIAALLGALALLPATANAASSANKDERIMRAVEEVVAEHKIYATCLALDGGHQTRSRHPAGIG